METPANLMTAGGPIVPLLLVMSVLSLALIVVKIVQFRGTLGGGDVRAAAVMKWSEGDRKAATDILAQGQAPADRVLRAAMEALSAGRPKAAVDADMEWRGNAEIAALSRHIRLLELVAMISPLLGLLGTVLGMIQSFQELSAAGGAANASILAGGIWQALLTTAAGLIVAIPAAVAASMLGERVERTAHTIEAAVGQLLASDRSSR
ncbi:MAG: MotA/TolQ/ExbB proton channel family protein [Paracoccaceae bacterium]